MLDVVGHRVVEPLLVGREGVAYGVSSPFGEQRRAVKLKQVLLDQAAHGALGVDALAFVAHGPFELILVYQRHKELEILGLAVVRRGREQQQVGRKGSQQPSQPKALGGLGTVCPHGGAHFVGLVADNQVPTGLAQQGLHLVAAGQLVKPGDG